MYVTFIKRLWLAILFLTLTCCQSKQHKGAQTIIEQPPKIDSNLKTTDGKIVRFASTYSFDNFKTWIFQGKTVMPDFTNNEFSGDSTYVKFINEGCQKNQINFGGHYTIIQKSCGALCSTIFIVDRVSGKIFTDTKPNDGRYGYLYQKDSELLIANSSVFQDDSLKFYNNFFGEPELYVWNDNNFQRLE